MIFLRKRCRKGGLKEKPRRISTFVKVFVILSSSDAKFAKI